MKKTKRYRRFAQRKIGLLWLRHRLHLSFSVMFVLVPLLVFWAVGNGFSERAEELPQNTTLTTETTEITEPSSHPLLPLPTMPIPYIAPIDPAEAALPGEEEFVLTEETVFALETMEHYLAYMYTVDPSAYALLTDFHVDILSKVDLTTDLFRDEPTVLVFHTHAGEAFADATEDYGTIVDVGAVLVALLEQAGVSVIHDRTRYDVENGVPKTEGSYERMEIGVQALLEEHPSIEVMIDLHRNGVPDDWHLVTKLGGVDVAQLMMFNGITRLNDGGVPAVTDWILNPYVKENMALSQRMYLYGMTAYPDLMLQTYIRPYRYSLHMRPKSMLVEVGAQTNTVGEAINAMPYLADMILTTLAEETTRP